MDLMHLTRDELLRLRDSTQRKLESIKGWTTIVWLLKDLEEINNKLDDPQLIESNDNEE